MHKPTLLVIIGPTGIGKTDLGLDLAENIIHVSFLPTPDNCMPT